MLIYSNLDTRFLMLPQPNRRMWIRMSGSMGRILREEAPYPNGQHHKTSHLILT